MKHVCIMINKVLIFLDCNHETRRPSLKTIQYINMKIELTSQRREMLLFLSSNVAAVMSGALKPAMGLFRNFADSKYTTLVYLPCL